MFPTIDVCLIVIVKRTPKPNFAPKCILFWDIGGGGGEELLKNSLRVRNSIR